MQSRVACSQLAVAGHGASDRVTADQKWEFLPLEFLIRTKQTLVQARYFFVLL